MNDDFGKQMNISKTNQHLEQPPSRTLTGANPSGTKRAHESSDS